MNRMRKSFHGRAVSRKRVFADRARSFFRASYPEGAHRLEHQLVSNPLLELDAIALLGDVLPETSVEYNRGDLPIGVDGKPEGNGLTIGETIRGIHENDSWAVLKNIEQKKPYADLLHELLGELRPVIEERTGKMQRLQAYIFVSSPNAMTPYHFDPEHNILLQLTGQKTMTVFPAGDARFAPDQVHEAYHVGGPRELKWRDEFLPHGVKFDLSAGEAVYVPVMAPHFVRNGPEVSISLSITWRSDWSFNEADARAFNHLLRRFGVTPRAPKRWPASNRLKALGMRIARRIPGLA